MKGNRRHRPSPATVIALLALFVSLGGSAYAINKIGTNQIRNGAVTKPKLATNIKRKLDQKTHPGARGARGPTGPTGPTGTTGTTGTTGHQGDPGTDGIVDPNRLYEVTATRTGSGVVTATCNTGDWVPKRTKRMASRNRPRKRDINRIRHGNLLRHVNGPRT